MNVGGKIVWPVVLYSCETRFLLSREGHRLNVFESKAMRKNYGQIRSRKQENIAQWVP